METLELYEYIELWFRNTGNLYMHRLHVAQLASEDRLTLEDVESLVLDAWAQLVKEHMHTFYDKVISQKAFEVLLHICIMNDTAYLKDHITEDKL